MDKFINHLNKSKFRRTNSPWNELMLNDPWSVGYVSRLIESRPFITKEEWETYYYESGKERIKKISEFSLKNQALLNNESLIRYQKERVQRFTQGFKELNWNYGRTKLELHLKGELLYSHIKNKHSDITLEDCQSAVRQRVICDTWNGIILREHNTVEKLKEQFKDISFVKKDGDFDYQYGVDYELYKSDKLVCAIQIKPKSYQGHNEYIEKARMANQKKNKAFKERFGKPVYDVISKLDGSLINKEVIKKIERMVKA